jgi:hypothetical protein
VNLPKIEDKIPGSFFAYIAVILVLGVWSSLIAAFTGTGVYTGWLPYLYGSITAALLILTLVNWKKLYSAAGITWRRILIAGILITGLTGASIYAGIYERTIFSLSIIYWMAAPGFGFKINSDFLENFSERYIILSHLSVFATLIFIMGYFTGSEIARVTSSLIIALTHSSAAYTTLKTGSK